MKFWNSKTGNIAAVAALTMPIIVGGAGLGVETGYWYYEQMRLQQAADAAAYAAALEQRGGSEEDGTLAKATAMAEANGFDPDEGTIEVNTPSTLETDETNSVDVKLTREIPRGFTALFSSEPILISVKASAAFSTAANACVLALDKEASPAITFSGNARAEMAGCVVMSNSIGSGSILFEGNSDVEAPCITTVGGYDKQDNATYHLTECSDVSTGQPPAGDPYKDLDYPTAACAASACPTFSVANNGTGAATPGTYKSFKVNSNAKATMAAGVYIINGGTLDVAGNAKLSGTDVTFVLMNGATVTFNGTSHIDLTAPTSGDYKGMLVMGSRDSDAGGISKFNGDATSNLTGALYFPKEDIQYNGNFSGNGGCTQIVANRVTWTGNTKFNVDCSAQGLEPIKAGSAVRLIG